MTSKPNSNNSKVYYDPSYGTPMLYQKFIAIIFFVFLFFVSFSQNIITRENFGDFILVTEKDMDKINILCTYKNKIDTLWTNSSWIMTNQIDRIHTAKICDDNKFILIYSMYSIYIYCARIWDGIGWGDSFVSVIASSSTSTPTVKLLDYNLLEVKRKNSIVRILYDIENKNEKREVIKD